METWFFNSVSLQLNTALSPSMLNEARFPSIGRQPRGCDLRFLSQPAVANIGLYIQRMIEAD